MTTTLEMEGKLENFMDEVAKSIQASVFLCFPEKLYPGEKDFKGEIADNKIINLDRVFTSFWLVGMVQKYGIEEGEVLNKIVEECLDRVGFESRGKVNARD